MDFNSQNLFKKRSFFIFISSFFFLVLFHPFSQFLFKMLFSLSDILQQINGEYPHVCMYVCVCCFFFLVFFYYSTFNNEAILCSVILGFSTRSQLTMRIRKSFKSPVKNILNKNRHWWTQPIPPPKCLWWRIYGFGSSG